MGYALMYFVGLLGPVLLVGAGLFSWSYLTHSAALARILHWFALCAGAILTIVTAALVYALTDCFGNILYGMTHCARLSVETGNAILAANWIAYLTAIVLTLLIVLTGIVMGLLHDTAQAREGQKADEPPRSPHLPPARLIP
ncbi:hypothetical protein [Hasllibacter sp. MH4015]|uniref:hypothetical protein n=1 Tax=Hasllibacter sp. MH4015 TaxID=2854029 RepID=UPI001CD194B5|nr:hypothetical protein [Hasllibacter sp. MH4015]